MMKRIATGLAVALAAVLPGCIDIEETIILNEDGSGTISSTLRVPLALAESDEKFKGLQGDALLAKLQEDTRSDLEKKLPAGFTLEDVTAAIADEEFVEATVVLAFDSLAAFEKIQPKGVAPEGPAGPAGPGEEEKGLPVPLARRATLEKKDGAFVFRQTILQSAGETPEAQGGEQFESLIRGVFAGHKLTLRVSLPKDVESADGASVDGDTATWEIPIAKTVGQKELGPFEARSVK